MATANLDAYQLAITVPALIKDPILQSGQCVYGANGELERYVGGYCVVFPYKLGSGKKYAVRCWHCEVEDAQLKSEAISKKIREINLPYFVEFEYVPVGIIANAPMPLVRMGWVEAEDFRKYITKNLNNKDILERVLENFVEMVKTLHSHNISHGDLQHGNVLVKPDGNLLLVDYDSMYIDELKDSNNTIAGLSGFQHPSRIRDTHPSSKADYFSELVIYITFKAAIEAPHLWKKYKCDQDSQDLIFKSTDFEDISQSTAYREIYDISDDMAKLVSKLKDSCQIEHFEDLHPLEEVISDLGVKTTQAPINATGMFGKLVDSKTEARSSRGVNGSAQPVNVSGIFSQMNDSKAKHQQSTGNGTSSVDPKLEAQKVMGAFSKHMQEIKNKK